LRPWAANRALYPADDKSEFGPLESLLILPADQRFLSAKDWASALESHCISLDMASSVQSGDVEEFLSSRLVSLEGQLGAFLKQRCEWEFEDTPPLDSLILDDEGNEQEELSDEPS